MTIVFTNLCGVLCTITISVLKTTVYQITVGHGRLAILTGTQYQEKSLLGCTWVIQTRLIAQSLSRDTQYLLTSKYAQKCVRSATYCVKFPFICITFQHILMHVLMNVWKKSQSEGASWKNKSKYLLSHKSLNFIVQYSWTKLCSHVVKNKNIK